MKINFKIKFQLILVFFIFVLIGVNIYLFGQSLILGEAILKMEQEINRLKIENYELEKKLFSLTSLESLKKQAEKLGFTHQPMPFYVGNLKYAFNQ